jgi:hypothetical protein
LIRLAKCSISGRDLVRPTPLRVDLPQETALG